ncbi:hypothetical protein HMPREF1977_1834 [Capnocytophaga ochracea F0287]|uniref:Uncharacterized protein n=1 Tax=Capnocytophaga ochracea F0287 TaxID=873517 RepID=E4MTW2_CAPOC|nr:hypothetical protein HMPREF1977_1834 [Capnocytophaga ochracea F0287]
METKILFLCPNNNFMSGGVKQIFRQAETLKKMALMPLSYYKVKVSKSGFIVMHKYHIVLTYLNY